MSDRTRQNVPRDLVSDLMHIIRTGFYQGDARWFADQHFIRRNVVTWPAGWLNGRGVTLPPERYKTIMVDIIMEIKRHGQTEAVKYWPGYLMRCVQSHFRIHEDEIYNEAKALSAQVASALSDCKLTRQADPVQVIAMVHKMTQLTKRLSRKSKGQMDLL